MCFPTQRHPFSNHHAAATNFFLPFLFLMLVCPGIPQLSLKKAEAKDCPLRMSIEIEMCIVEYVMDTQLRSERKGGCLGRLAHLVILHRHRTPGCCSGL